MKRTAFSILLSLSLCGAFAQTQNTGYPNQDKNGINQSPTGVTQDPTTLPSNPNSQNGNNGNLNGAPPNGVSTTPNVQSPNTTTPGTYEQQTGINSNNAGQNTNPSPNNTGGNSNPAGLPVNPSGTHANTSTGIPNSTSPYVNGLWWDYGQQSKLLSTDVPATISGSYYKQYPKQSNTTWYTGQNGYMASYLNGNVEEQVMYDKNGKVIGSGKQLPPTSTPSGINSYISKEYPGETTRKTYMLTTPEGKTIYRVSINGKWSTFDSNGNFISPK